MNRREIGVNFLCLHSEAIKTLSPQRDVGTPNFQHIVNSKLSCPRRTMGGGAFLRGSFSAGSHQVEKLFAYPFPGGGGGGGEGEVG